MIFAFCLVCYDCVQIWSNPFFMQLYLTLTVFLLHILCILLLTKSCFTIKWWNIYLPWIWRIKPYYFLLLVLWLFSSWKHLSLAYTSTPLQNHFQTMDFGKSNLIYQIYLSLMKYLIFLLQLILANVLEHFGDDWIVLFGRWLDDWSVIFCKFYIKNFYPSISMKLFTDSIEYAKNFMKITDQDLEIILQARKTLLFELVDFFRPYFWLI